MSKPKRYKVGKIGTAEMIDCVSYEDYARLRSVAEDNKRECEATRIENARLKDEVERLTFDPLTYLDDQGEWMPRHTHLAAVERLKAEVERLTVFTTRTIIPNEELQAQVERLTKQNALATPRHLIASQDIKTLREQVKRLTKAGDELHAFLINYIVESRISSAYLNKLDDDWNAAKEGKPSV